MLLHFQKINKENFIYTNGSIQKDGLQGIEKLVKAPILSRLKHACSFGLFHTRGSEYFFSFTNYFSLNLRIEPFFKVPSPVIFSIFHSK